MSKLQELIQRLCPDGVEYRPLWSLTIWDKNFNGVNRSMQPKIISYPYVLANVFDEIEDERGDVRLLSTGIGGRERWTTEEKAGSNLCEGEIIAIPWGGTPNVKYYKGKFVTADNRIATSSDTAILSNKFLYYWLNNNIDLIAKTYRGAGIQHPSMSQVLNIVIPVPPLEVQEEIVRILDRFDVYAAELQAELQARKEQYEYYRNLLLTFNPAGGAGEADDEQEGSVTTWGGHSYPIQWKTMGEICSRICSGGTPSTSNKSYYEGEIPWLRTQEVDWKDVYDTEIKISKAAIDNSSAKLMPANCVIIAMYGATAAKACINRIPLSTNQACCNLQINPQIANYKYVYYWICNSYKVLKGMGEGSQHNINTNKIKTFPIPIPPLELQEKIVAILDRFETLVNDLSEGLPAEIAAVKEQYEYYRNRLLTFKEKTA